MYFIKFFLYVFLLICCHSNTLAHQQKAAVTTISIDQTAQLLQVTHRVYIHDAEHILKQVIMNKKFSRSDLQLDTKAQKALGEYVSQQFALRRHANKTIKLNYLGQEVEGKFLWVYQEIPITETMSDLSIKHDVFRKVWPSQRNLVNVEQQGELRSLEFSGADEWQSVRFEKSMNSTHK